MAVSGERIRVLLADGQALFREALKSVLEGHPDIEVVAEARDGLEAVAEAERVSPDVALLDANLPHCDGIKATALIREKEGACPIVIVAAEADEATLVEAVEAGASGFLTKESPLEDLITAARAVSEGRALIPGHLLAALLTQLVRRRRERDEGAHLLSRLTRREREVLALLAEGANNDRIAEVLVISPQTARTHIQNVLGKLGVHSRLEAAALVTRVGMLEELAATVP